MFVQILKHLNAQLLTKGCETSPQRYSEKACKEKRRWKGHKRNLESGFGRVMMSWQPFRSSPPEEALCLLCAPAAVSSTVLEASITRHFEGIFLHGCIGDTVGHQLLSTATDQQSTAFCSGFILLLPLPGAKTLKTTFSGWRDHNFSHGL